MSQVPRLPQRSRRTNGDSYTWLGVLWLLAMAGGFLLLFMAILPLLNVLGAILGLLALNGLAYLTLGRWVARRIAAGEARKVAGEGERIAGPSHEAD